MIVCRPRDLVLQLLDQPVPEEFGAMVCPGILYMDSMGGKGLLLCKAAAIVLTKFYLETEPKLSLSTEPKLPKLSDPALDTIVLPDISVPKQEDFFSCGDFVLHGMRRFIKDVIKQTIKSPDQADASGSGGAGGEIAALRIEDIINPTWFSTKDANAERTEISNALDLLAANVQSQSALAEEDDGLDCICDEIKTQQGERDRETKLAKEVVVLLSSLHDEAGTISREQVSFVCLMEPHLVIPKHSSVVHRL